MTSTLLRSTGLDEAVARAFRPHPSPGRRVGLEIELIPDVPTYELSDRGRTGARLGREVEVSVEPGGQVELSLGPRPSATEAVRDAVRAIDRARRRAAREGVTLQLVGVNPTLEWFDVPLRIATPRYLAMQELFDECGHDGRRMMRTTASLQVCVDLLPGAAGVDQWVVANLMGPALAVAFDNTPGSSPAGGSRTAIWRGVDLRRTGYDGRHVDASDPVGAYAAFAAAAEPLPIEQALDPDYHLSTLFPPVRPRGRYLELRFLDAQPVDRIEQVVRTVAALMYDPVARHQTLDLLDTVAGDLDSAWAAAAAGHAPHIPDLLEIAAAGAARLAHDETEAWS
ncbi:glutamate-cysteine ligase family protein [Monashia sp. NPDC004114]